MVGIARIDGRLVVVGGDDFTIRGGAYTAVGLRKGQYADELAIRRRIPVVRLLEGGGASVTGASGVRGRSGYDLTASSPLNLLCMEALATVPVVCAALGPVAGFPAARLVASHFSLMTRQTAQVLTGGPALVERALGEKLSKEELGGAEIHLRSGVVQNVAEDEPDAWRQIRALPRLPARERVGQPRRSLDAGDPPSRAEEELISIIPRDRRRAYKIRRVIELVVDRGSFFEMAPLFGRSLVTGLARLQGQPVGLIANDCHHLGGCMSADAAQKIRRIVELCDAFRLPIVSLVDEPGFAIGPEAERAATIRHGMAAMFAVLQSDGALGRGGAAPGVRRGGGHPPGAGAHGAGLAVGGDRGAPGRERRRAGLPARDRGGARPRRPAQRARAASSPPRSRSSRAPRISACTR